MIIVVHIDRRARGDHAVWRLWWREGGRKRTRESGEWTRTEAEEAAEVVRDRLAGGTSTLWSKFVEKYISNLTQWWRPASSASARSVLRRYEMVMAPWRMGDVTREKITAYLAGGLGAGVVIREGAAPLRPLRGASFNKHVRTLKAAFRWAKSTGLVRENPFEDQRRVREVHLRRAILERREDWMRLADEIARDGARWEAAVLLGLECGLRLGEISHLAWASVSLEAGEAEIRPEADGWVPKERAGMLVMGERLVASLIRVKKEAGAKGDRALGGADPGRFEREFRRRLRAACKRAGLPDVKPHGLRRSFGNEGMEAVQLQRVMRHSDIKTTLTYYIRVNDRRAAEEARRMIERAL
jgi:integrase